MTRTIHLRAAVTVLAAAAALVTGCSTPGTDPDDRTAGHRPGDRQPGPL